MTGGITKAVTIPGSFTLSGPNGNPRFWCFGKTCGIFDTELFVSSSSIPVLEIRESWVGQYTISHIDTSRTFWEQDDIDDAFRVLTKVEDLAFVGCKMEPFFGLSEWQWAIVLSFPTYGGPLSSLDVPGFIPMRESKEGMFQPTRGSFPVFEKEPGSGLVQGVEVLRDFVGELICRIGKAPRLFWLGESCVKW